jgi:hypothetical protein
MTYNEAIDYVFGCIDEAWIAYHRNQYHSMLVNQIQGGQITLAPIVMQLIAEQGWTPDQIADYLMNSNPNQDTSYPPIYWPGQNRDANAPMNEVWSRPTFSTVTSGQTSLANEQGLKKFTWVCLLIFQVISPKSLNDAVNFGRDIAQNILVTFRKQPSNGDIRFSNQKIVEVTPTDTSFPINVVITCTFDEYQ